MGDRYFDLGNLSVNNGFEAEDDRALLELYFERAGHRAALRGAAADARDLRLPRGDVGRRAGRALRRWTSTSPPTPPSTSTGCERAAADPRFEEWLADAATA